MVRVRVGVRLRPGLADGREIRAAEESRYPLAGGAGCPS